MTEDQIPLMAFIAFAGGIFAGLWAWRRRRMMIAILWAVALVDAAGWMVYSFIVNWQLTFNTTWGLTTPGAVASFRLVAQTADGHERGSAPVVIARPL